MKYVVFTTILFALFSCSSETETPVKKEDVKAEQQEAKEAPVDKTSLVEVKGNTYTEYYDPAKTKIKYKGLQDEKGERHGKWTMFSETGKELSVSFYKHGVLHGHSIVKRENGTVYYYGEYEDGQRVGVWKTYDEDGNLISETDHGTEK